MEVRVHQPNIGRRTITGFPSIAEAEHWIEIQKRHQPPVGLGPQLSGPYTNPQARIVRPVDLPAEGRRDSGAAAACRSVFLAKTSIKSSSKTSCRASGAPRRTLKSRVKYFVALGSPKGRAATRAAASSETTAVKCRHQGRWNSSSRLRRCPRQNPPSLARVGRAEMR